MRTALVGLVGLGAGLALLWLVLVGFLLAARPPRAVLAEAVRLLPDTVRLLRRLAADRSLPAGVRLRLGGLLAYLALPLDLVPDFLPLVGHADDAIIVAAVLRSVVRRAGPEAVRRHWPGTPEGLEALWRVARLPAGSPAG